MIRPNASPRPTRAAPPFAILAAGLALVALFPADGRALALGALALGVALALVLWGPAALATRRAGTEQAQAADPDASLRAVVEAMPEPAFLVDRAQAMRFGNRAALPAFGALSPGDPIAMRFRSPDVLHAVETAIEQGAPQSADFAERAPADRFWSVDVLPVASGDDAPPRFFLVLFRDRTASLRLERMRTDFVANASHELRTPLASLTGFIETLRGPARDDAAARERFLGIMLDQAQRMSRLIDDLLSLSRIETKRRLAADERADLADVLRQCCRETASEATEAGVALEPEGLGLPVLVNGDPDELIQVFSNLVENACKYGADGGRIVVGLRVHAGGRVCEAFVRDFGRGIAPEHVPRLTERFYRVEDGLRRRGTGLGLSIVRNVLSRHRTRLLIASTPGEGSTFSVKFEVAADEVDRKNEYLAVA